MPSGKPYISSQQDYIEAIKDLWQIDLNGQALPGAELHSLLKFIHRTLWSFQLSSYYQTEEILHEAILRGSNSITKGYKIQNLTAWLRGTCFNLIREFSRLHQKIKELQTSDIEIIQARRSEFSYLAEEDSSPEGWIELKLKLESYLQNLESINSDEYQILYQQFFLDKSWQEIQQYFVKQGKSLSIDALRKRGERARAKLANHLGVKKTTIKPHHE